MGSRSEYLTVRIDAALKEKIATAAQIERRSISNMGMLLLEFAWSRYVALGSIEALLSKEETKTHKAIK